MPTQAQFDTSLQPIRDIDCKIVVLNYDFTILDEISGRVEDISANIDAQSDIRRTANINIILKDNVYQTESSRFYWTVGNPYWFDKYIQIYIGINDVHTQEYVWVNEGVYLVNAPSISYTAETNVLSFEAVDLMSKLTGMRNGQLEGMTYTVPAGSSIKGAVEGILLEQGFTQYILYDAPQSTTPTDINIDAGGTAYDLLCQLRDINSNWEMFFDVDGVFHWQQIPSGKVITNPSTGETGEPQPLVDMSVWDNLYIDYSYNTSFEDVKNCVNVLGKVHEVDEFATANITGNAVALKLSKSYTNYLNNTWQFGFGIDVDNTGIPKALANPINAIYILDSNNTNISYIDISNTPIVFGNEQFVVECTIGTTISVIQSKYLGFLQPRATAIENNPDSPFYIGTSTQYKCKLDTQVDFADEREIIVSDVGSKVSTNIAYVDVRPWISASAFSSASQGTKWKFKVHVSLSNNTAISSLVVYVAGQTVTGTIKGLNNQTISLDYSQDYMLVVSKGSTSTPIINVLYYPTPASVLPMSTTSLINLPKFNNQVRLVCSGDEYDNIYTNDLAEQRARYEIYLHSRLHDNITITSVPIYWLDVNQIIEFNLSNNTTGESDLWLIQSISTTISADGTQTINAMRYYPLYADISLENLATQ
jgi:hypothetical protein